MGRSASFQTGNSPTREESQLRQSTGRLRQSTGQLASVLARKPALHVLTTKRARAGHEPLSMTPGGNVLVIRDRLAANAAHYRSWGERVKVKRPHFVLY